jgi:hypothetical protein
MHPLRQEIEDVAEVIEETINEIRAAHGEEVAVKSVHEASLIKRSSAFVALLA